MSEVMIITVIVFFIVLAAFVFTYNKGVKLKNYVKEAFSIMDVYLKKRWDLVPNLLQIVKAFATHEKSVFETVTELRNGNYARMSDLEKISLNEKLSKGITVLTGIVENYPELKSDLHFSQLMKDLSLIENDIANSRKYYNGTVREYNNYCEIFPTNITANIFGFKPAKMFEAEDYERSGVKVSF